VRKNENELRKYREGAMSSRKSGSDKEKRKPSNDWNGNSERKRQKRKKRPTRQMPNSRLTRSKTTQTRRHNVRRSRENDKLARRY